ncbi:PAS domain S-box protein [Thermodesulfobacteriota bacterium]
MNSKPTISELETRIEERTAALRDALEALQESEDFTSSLLSNAPNPILVINPDTSIRYVNPALEKLSGFSSKELIGERAPYPWWTKDTLHKTQKDFNEAIHTGARKVEELFQTKNGDLYWVEITSAPVESKGEFKYYLSNWVDTTERKRAEEHIHRLTQQLMKTQENERQNISRELHDRVGQDLSMLKIGLDTLFDDQSVVPDELTQKVAEFSKILQKSVAAVRDIAYNLRPPILDQLGLVRTIFRLCEDFSAKTGLHVDFNAAGMDCLNLDFDTEINLYRLVQEGLNNIHKHAEAKKAIVRLVASFPNIILRIEDDGKGFDIKNRLTAASYEKRMGLRIMEERINLLGGKIRIQSFPMEGVKVCIEVPGMENKIGG